MRIAATILLCLIFAADAHAATVSVDGSTLQVTAAPGEVNQIAIAPRTGVLSVTDPGAPLTAGAGCATAGAAIECPSSGILALTADLGDADDTLTSTSSLPLLATDGDGADRVTGGNGSDIFIASPGADLYQGGGGTDLVSYAARQDPVVADLAGGVQEDDFAAVENLIGGAGADRLTGTTSANSLYGGAGDDVLDGRTGADRLEGGPGIDTADYSARTSAVTADLDGSNDDGVSFERDRITTDVERLLGGTANDTLTGDNNANALVGGAGNDRLDGNGGDDAFDAGAGDDRVWGDAGNDTFTLAAGKDQAWGGDDADTLAGGDNEDTLSGERGDDRVYGEEGNDTLSGGDGADALSGALRRRQPQGRRRRRHAGRRRRQRRSRGRRRR